MHQHNDDKLIPTPEQWAHILATAMQRTRETFPFDDHHPDTSRLPAAFDREEQGCIGEWGLHAHFGKPWTTPAGKGIVDAGVDLQARASVHRYPRLRFTPHDDPDHRFALMRIHAHGLPETAVQLVGWMWGHECRLREWWRPDVSEWWVPQGALRRPGTLTWEPPHLEAIDPARLMRDA